MNKSTRNNSYTSPAHFEIFRWVTTVGNGYLLKFLAWKPDTRTTKLIFNFFLTEKWYQDSFWEEDGTLGFDCFLLFTLTVTQYDFKVHDTYLMWTNLYELTFECPYGIFRLSFVISWNDFPQGRLFKSYPYDSVWVTI